MRFDLSRLRRGGVQPNTVDGRGQTFFVGQSTKASEVLDALPMVKGEGLAVSSAGDLVVLVKRAPTVLPTAAFYDASTTLPSIPSLPGTEQEIKLGRIGLQFEKLIIDDKATPAFTAHREMYYKTLTATYLLLREIDLTIARGNVTTTTLAFLGLEALSTASGRTSPTSGNVDSDARLALSEIHPSGTGTGAGPCCLIGNDRMLRKLMSTLPGQVGTSGWRHDPRSGRFVYHYAGVPFYRTDVETVTGTPDTTRLYAANLGPTGLNLVYAYGTPDSYGLEVQEVSAAPSVSVKELAVHGAYALALWEPEGLWEITGIDVSGSL